tara:strand:- start:17501 stop:17740 length:240 start_codon:yes stop_codon:yes gene_type:complete
MPKPSKPTTKRTHVTPSSLTPIPNYSGKNAKNAPLSSTDVEKIAEESRARIAPYDSASKRAEKGDCVYNKGFTGLKLGG